MGCLTVNIQPSFTSRNLNVGILNTPSIAASGIIKNESLGINMSLVCSVNLNYYEYFNVVEGPFIVEDGYFKVRRN